MSGRGKHGGPHWFKCTRCRGTVSALTMTLTGKKRRAPKRAGGRRAMSIAVEYRCACGHTGWSRHVDMRRVGAAELER